MFSLRASFYGVKEKRLKPLLSGGEETAFDSHRTMRLTLVCVL
jgi:hypothetical protein